MNRTWVMVVTGFMVVLAVSSFVSAYYFPSARTFTQDIVNTYVDVLEPILQALFGGYGWSGLYLFERFLLFILLMSLIFVILAKIEMFEKNLVVRWIVAIVVPLIGIRFVDFEWLTALLMSYQAFAIAVTTALPLILFFYFIHAVGKDYPHMRKVLWLLFIGIYIGLWSTATTSGTSEAYFWTFIAALVFLFFDHKIEQYLFKQEKRKAGQYWKYDAIARLQEDIRVLNASALPPNEKRKAVEQKQKEIVRISKMDIY